MTVSVKAPTSTTGSIQLNGSDVLTIDSSGNLTAPNNLTVTGTVTQTGGATFNGGISGNVAFDTDTLYVDATNNNVGIGTTAPSTGFGGTISNVKLALKGSGAGGNNGTATLLMGGDNNHYSYLSSEHTGGGSTYLAFGTANGAANPTERMRIDSSGDVGIGTSSPSTTLHVKSPTTTSSGVFAATIEQAKTNNGTATTGLRVKYTSVSPGDGNHIFRCEDSGGTYRFYVQNNGTHGGTSDRTLKENIVDATDKLTDLRKIKVRNYNWIEHGPEGGFKELGFIAQEVEEVFPKLVKENPETGKKMLLDSVFVPILVKSLQEAADKIDALETRIQALESANV